MKAESVRAGVDAVPIAAESEVFEGVQAGCRVKSPSDCIRDRFSNVGALKGDIRDRGFLSTNIQDVDASKSGNMCHKAIDS